MNDFPPLMLFTLCLLSFSTLSGVSLPFLFSKLQLPDFPVSIIIIIINGFFFFVCEKCDH